MGGQEVGFGGCRSHAVVMPERKSGEVNIAKAEGA